MRTAERLTADAVRVMATVLVLEWTTYLVGLTNTLIGLVVALVVLARWTRLFPFGGAR